MNKVTTNPQFVSQPVASDRVTPHVPPAGTGQASPASRKATSGDPVAPKKSKQNQSSDPARKKDLVELHNRIVKMMTTLNEGLSASAEQKAQRDRAELVGRIDEMQTAINQMEGALRIELAPAMRAIVQEELHAHAVRPRKTFWKTLIRTCLIAAAILAGALFSEQILQFGAQVTDWISPVQEKLVPLWGHLTGRESI